MDLELWTAIRENTLEAFVCRLQRFLHDAREWPEVQNIGAVFAARQKAT